ncbi:MAG: extracellular solute-binding protein [Burkholderiales bacterium]|nr:extracellular solute-binding protein [Burkholderiales bacterium]
MRMKILSALLAAGTLCLTAASAWSQQPSGAVSLYTSNNAEAVATLTELARKQLPQVKVGAVTGGSATLLKRIEAEAAAPKADIFWSSSPNVLGGFKGNFAPYTSPEAKAIPANLIEPNHLWTGCNIHVVVVMVNTKQLAGLPAPATWKELADPRWKGKIIVADPAASSTAYTVLFGASKVLDANAFKALAKNVTVSRNASAVLSSVAQGEYAIGLTFESNAYAYVAGGQKEIKLVYPIDGTFVTEEAIVLVKNAPNPAAARAFYDMALSKDAQIALLERAFRRPSRTDIEVGKYVELPELKSIKVFPISDAEAQAKRTEFLAQWQQLQGN